MKTWRLLYNDPYRKGIVETEIFAQSRELAIREAREKGQIVKLERKYDFRFFKRYITVSERQIFMLRFGTMLECRIGASESLLLIEKTFGGSIKRVSHMLLKYIQNGDDLSRAFEKVGSPDFNSSVIALIKAGARSGKSGVAIKNAAQFESELMEIKKKDYWHVIFSLIGFVFAAITICITKFYLAGLILNSPLVQMSKAKIDNGWAIALMDTTFVLVAFLGVMLSAVAAVSTIGRIIDPIQSDKIIHKIPFFRDVLMARINFITLFGLSAMIENGVPMERSLRIAAESTRNGLLKNDLMKASKAVENGRPWAQKITTLHPTDRAALSSALDRDQLARSIKSLSAQYKMLYQERLEAMTPVLMMTSSLLLVIAGAVLFGLGVEPLLQVAAEGF
jgi:general secretion pathway protein F